MSEKKRPLWERLLLQLLYYVNGRASFKEAFIRFFLPCYLASLAFRMIFINKFPYLLAEGPTFIVAFVFTAVEFLSLIVLWQCAQNLNSKFQFYLVRAICGFLLAVGTLILVVDQLVLL